ncbi:MAG: hypothetical protein QM739_16745 [Propionivibrio sp.]
MEYLSTIISVLGVAVLVAALLNPLPSLRDPETDIECDHPSEPQNGTL